MNIGPANATGLQQLPDPCRGNTVVTGRTKRARRPEWGCRAVQKPCMDASRQRSSRSAPENPSVRRPSSRKSTSLEVGVSSIFRRSSSARSWAASSPTWILRSKRRKRAASRSSSRFVAARTFTGAPTQDYMASARYAGTDLDADPSAGVSEQ